MIVNIATNQLQVTTVKNTAQESAVIRQWSEIKHQLGLMVNHLSEIGQDLVRKLRHGEKKFLFEINTPANIVEINHTYTRTMLLNGQKMKANALRFQMGLLCVLSATAKFMEDGLAKRNPKYCQVIVDRMLKLDPSIEIKLNGKPYIKKDVNSEVTANA